MAHRRTTEQNRQFRNAKARRRVVGLGASAGAFLALGMVPLATAPRAHADIEDLFQPISDAIAQAINSVDPGLASSLDPGLDVGSVAAAALPADAADNATIPLTMDGTDPLVHISVGGGPSIPVIVDTGSQGVILPWYDVGLQNLLSLASTHLTFGTVGYGGSPDVHNIEVVYAEDPNTTVNFGDGIVSSPTTVNLALFAYPESSSNFFNLDDWSLQAYDGSNGADGTMGIAAQPYTPGPSSVVTALPGDLSEGVLINETAGYLEFGPNPLTALGSVDGVPGTDLEVSVGDGGAVPISAVLDSGGQVGTMPVSILNNAPAVGDPLAPGTQIAVYMSDGQEIYSYVTSSGDSPIVSSDTVMNTGWAPFQAYPIYISYSPTGEGTLVFDQ
jgi:hypothetical protein